MKHVKLFLKKLICVLLCHSILFVNVVGCGNTSQSHLIQNNAENELHEFQTTKTLSFNPKNSSDHATVAFNDPGSNHFDRLLNYFSATDYSKEPGYIDVGPPHIDHERHNYPGDKHKDGSGRDTSPGRSQPVINRNTGQKIGDVILDKPGMSEIGSEGTLIYTKEYIEEIWAGSVSIISEGETFFTENQMNQFKLGMATVGIRIVFKTTEEIAIAPNAQKFFIDLTKKPIQNGRPALPSQMNGDSKQPSSQSTKETSNTFSTTNYIQGPATPAITGTPSTNTIDPSSKEILNDGGAGQTGQSIIGSTTTTLPPGATKGGPSEYPRGLPSKTELALSNTDTNEQVVTKLQEQAKLWADGFNNDAKDLAAKAEASATKIAALIKNQIETSNDHAAQIVSVIAPPAWMDTIPDTSVAKNYLPPDQIHYPGGYFETDAKSTFGKELQDADRYIRTTRDIVNSSSNTDPADVKNTKNSMLDVAEINVALADIANIEGNQLEAKAHLEMALNITDTVLDFVPGISLVKDIVSLTTGVNPITGETLSATELSFIAVGLFVPSAFSATTKRFAKLTSSISTILANSQRYQKFSRYTQDVLKKIPSIMKRADKEIETAAKVDVSAYLGHNLDFASARLGDYVTKAIPHLLADPEIVRTLDKWGTNSVEKGKVNQLLDHLFAKEYIDLERMITIEKKMSLDPGIIADAFNKKDIYSMKKGIKALNDVANNIKINPDKRYKKINGDSTKINYFRNPPSGNAKDSGIRVIETDNKTNTVFPTNFAKLEKDMIKNGFQEIE